MSLLSNNSKPSSIDPHALLTAHQEGRDRGARIVSVMCGVPGVARAVWGGWLVRRPVPGAPSGRCVVPPGPSRTEAGRALAFASGADSLPVLSAPEPDAFAEAFSTLRALAEEAPSRPLGLVTDPLSVQKFLQENPDGSEHRVRLRQALLGGLVVLDRQVESLLDNTVLRHDERPLYRSDHEQILHKLLVHDGRVPEAFQSNHKVPGGSAKRYEVDLWCAALKLALEVDGGQHVSNDRQRRKDAERDADLAAAGILTVRVHAAEVISDPSTVLSYVRSRIETRRTEIAP